MATVEQMQAWLIEAQNAYHALQTGAQMVEAQDSNGERARYTPANASRLMAYIEWLKAQIAGNGTPPPRRPLRPIFS